jgi:hypothetical protein
MEWSKGGIVKNVNFDISYFSDHNNNHNNNNNNNNNHNHNNHNNNNNDDDDDDDFESAFDNVIEHHQEPQESHQEPQEPHQKPRQELQEPRQQDNLQPFLSPFSSNIITNIQPITTCGELKTLLDSQYLQIQQQQDQLFRLSTQISVLSQNGLQASTINHTNNNNNEVNNNNLNNKYQTQFYN